MKSRTVLVLLVALALRPFTSSAQEKTFVKEYTYKASEMDSKVSCRAIAVNQLRSMLLNEVGVYVESEQILKTSDVGLKFSQDFVENIATVSAGITKLEILEEKWNGETFWMRAAITIDPESLGQSLKQLISDRQKVKELEALKKQLDSANNELAILTRELNVSKSKKNSNDLEGKYNDRIAVLNSSEFIYKGASKANLHDYKGAIADYSNAIRIDSANARAYYARGQSKEKLQDHVGAISDFTKAIRINRNYVNAYVERGVAKTRFENDLGAVAEYTKAIEIDPEHARAYYNRGHSRDKLGDFSAAVADFTKAIELYPNDAEAFLGRGVAKANLKDYKGAITDYGSAIEMDHDYAKAYYNRGISKAHLQDYKRSITDFTKAIDIDPNYVKAYYNRGISKIMLSQGKDGCMDLSKAGELGDKSAYEVMREHCK